jgi:hypothetical protein
MKMQKMIVGSLLVAGILCATGLVLVPAQAAPELLPPRPDTPTPMPTSDPASLAKTALEGTVIVLEVTFGDDWPARGLAWQDLWTVVEWQDTDSTWHEVAGWQGSLDKVADGLGWKAWWLSSDLLGQGPFRWVVYERYGGAVIAVSAPFDLPGHVGESGAVELSLAH